MLPESISRPAPDVLSGAGILTRRIFTEMIKQTENEVKAAIKKYLEVNGYTVYRINNAGMNVSQKGEKPRFAFHGTPGFSDLVAFKPGCVVVFVETKATGKKPSNTQCEFLSLASTCNAIAIWADSLDMFIKKHREGNL